MRKRFEFTEPQLAILTELLLRGRQQLGELRSRASRMVKIDGLPELREALAGLLEQGAVQASGPLERRGIDVDHNFYMPGETKPLAASAAPAEPPPAARQAAPTEPAPVSAPVAAQDDATAIALRQLLEQVAELTAAQEDLRNRVTDLSDRFDRLAREAGLQT